MADGYFSKQRSWLHNLTIQKVPIIGKWLIFSTKLLNMNKSLLGHSFHFLFFFLEENFAIYRNSFSTSSMCHVYMGIKIYLRKINVIGLKLLWFFSSVTNYLQIILYSVNLLFLLYNASNGGELHVCKSTK